MNTFDLDYANGSKANHLAMLPFISHGGAEPLQNRFGDYGHWKMNVGGDIDIDTKVQRVYAATAGGLKVRGMGAADAGVDVTTGVAHQAGSAVAADLPAAGYIGVVAKNLTDLRKVV